MKTWCQVEDVPREAVGTPFQEMFKAQLDGCWVATSLWQEAEAVRALRSLPV